MASVQDADRIIMMEGGRIAAIGTHEELMQSNDVYRELYNTQNRKSTILRQEVTRMPNNASTERGKRAPRGSCPV